MSEPQPIPNDRAMLIGEVAQFLRVSKAHVRGLIDAGQLGAVDIRKQGTSNGRAKRRELRILPEHLRTFCRRQTVKSAAPEPSQGNSGGGKGTYF